MATARTDTELPLTGGQLKVIRRWLGLQLGPFAELTSEGQATIARREQHDSRVTGATGALLNSINRCFLPFVINRLETLPPDFTPGASRNLVGCKSSVLRWMPLRRKFRIQACQRIGD